MKIHLPNRETKSKSLRVFILTGILFLFISIFPVKILAAVLPSVNFLQRWSEGSTTVFNTLVSLGDTWTPAYRTANAGKTYKIAVCNNLYLGDLTCPTWFPFSREIYEGTFVYNGEATQDNIRFFLNATNMDAFTGAGVALFDEAGNVVSHWRFINLRDDVSIASSSTCSDPYDFECGNIDITATNADGTSISDSFVHLHVVGQPDPLTISLGTGHVSYAVGGQCTSADYEVTTNGVATGAGLLTQIPSGDCEGRIEISSPAAPPPPAASARTPGSPPAIPTIVMNNFTSAAANAQRYAIGLGIFLSLFILPYVGILWASGNPENIQKATEWFQSWFWGLLLLLLSGSIIRIVGGEFLRIG